MTKRYLMCVILACCAVSACSDVEQFAQKNGGTFHSSISNNGGRTVTDIRDKTKRVMTTTANVQFRNGNATSVPPGAVLKIDETAPDGMVKKAEWRADGDRFVLWIGDGEQARKANDDEIRWGENFMRVLAINDDAQSGTQAAQSGTTVTTVTSNESTISTESTLDTGPDAKVRFNDKGGIASISGSYRAYSPLGNGGRNVTVAYPNKLKRVYTCDTAVRFYQGKVLGAVPKGAIVDLEETSPKGLKNRAEYREKDGGLELWVLDGNTFRLASEADKEWAHEFLSSMPFDDRPKSEIVATRTPKEVLADKLSSEQLDLVKAMCADQKLLPSRQVELVDAILDEITFSSTQADALLEVIKNQNFQTSTKKYLIPKLDKISFSSDREKVKDALLER